MISLLKLLEKVSERGGYGLLQSVLCAEAPSDCSLNFAQRFVVPNRSLFVWHRSAYFPRVFKRVGPSQRRGRPERPASLKGSRDQPSSKYTIDLVCRTEPPFGQGEQVCLIDIDAHARLAEDPSVVFVVILFGHGRKFPWGRHVPSNITLESRTRFQALALASSRSASNTDGSIQGGVGTR
jgi:hypothetical protein